LEAVTMQVFSYTVTTASTTRNLIADTRKGRSDRVIVQGSHMDSVTAGPGINDNGSGSSANLELAILMSGSSPVNKVRFAWWGAEEIGLLGSEFYVSNLYDTNMTQFNYLMCNLNYDMLGSPNWERAVYNGSSDENGPGSGVIEDLYLAWYGKLGLPTKESAFDGRSDYGPFLDYGIPAGGLAAGAEVIKTAAERTLFGGVANAAYDPCYHQACDTVDNISEFILEDMTKAAASVLETLAYEKDLVSFLNPPSSPLKAKPRTKPVARRFQPLDVDSVYKNGQRYLLQ